MCPTRGPEHELELERQRRAVAGYDLVQAQEMLMKLAQLCMHQELIIRGATRRIAELECREAVR